MVLIKLCDANHVFDFARKVVVTVAVHNQSVSPNLKIEFFLQCQKVLYVKESKNGMQK